MNRRSSGAQERWLRLSTLYDRASALPADRRAAFVQAECADDTAMRDELLRMFAAAEDSGPLDVPLRSLPSASAPIAERLQAALAGRYLLRGEIAQGGMGAVFHAHELKHHRDVILKVLRPDADLGAGRTRFESEVQIAAKLAHPHIVPLLDSGDAGGLLYFVMPHLPGETLRARIERLGAIPVPEALKLMRDIADALHYAHGVGVVHRDLKPENVLCSGEHAFLLDFGIAIYAESDTPRERITFEGNAVGTPRYMAPEQAAGNVVDHRADLFAWGIVANEMLHGNRRGDLDASGLRSDVPAALSTLIYRCLSPDPARRPSSAGTIVAALDALMAGASAPRRDAAPEPTPSPRGRRVAIVALVAVLAIVALAVLMPSRGLRVGDLPMPVAVLPFREDGAAAGERALGVRGRLAGAWITQGLHQTGIEQVLPWTDVLQAVEGQPDAEQALLKRTAVGTIVSGTIFDTPDAVTLHAELRDARGGRLLASLEPVRVGRDSLEQGIRLLRDRVMGAMAVTRDARFVGQPAVRQHPPTFEAYRAFDAALTAFHAQQYRPALAGFREAYALDSNFVTPLLYAAQAAWNTSQYALVDSLVTRLDARRSELADYHDHLRAQLRAALNGDGRAAYTAAAQAAALAPDSRAAYDAAVFALWLGWADSARTRLERLSPDRGAMIGWPSYWTTLAHARHLTGAHDLELRAAREMRARHPAARVAWVLEARALAALRDTLALEQLLREADRLEPDVYWSQAGMLVTAGEEFAAHGDSLLGMRWGTRAMAWLRPRLAATPDQADHLYWMASAQHLRADFAGERRTLERLLRVDGRQSYREALALAVALDDGRSTLAELPTPPPYDRGSRLEAEASLAAARGDVAARDAALREMDRVGFRSRPWMHGKTWRQLGVLPRR